MAKIILHIVYSLACIFGCLYLGYGINLIFGGLPGSLYGMILFAFLLKFQIFQAEKIKPTVQWIISHMGVCFVPAGVGIMNHFELLKTQGITIIFIIVFTTVLLISFIGLLHKYYLEKQDQ